MSKPLKDALRQIREDLHDPRDPLLDRPQEPLNRVPRHHPFIDRYTTGELGIYAFVRARVGDEWVAVFYWPFRAMERHSRLYAPMLVNSAEVVQGPQPVKPVPVGPVVRLFLLNETSRRVGDTAKLTTSDGFREERPPDGWLPFAVLVADDRKHQRFLNLGAKRSHLTIRERVNRVIKCGAEILDGVPDEDAEVRGRTTLDLRPANCVPRLGIYLTADGVGIRPEPVIDGLLDGFQVFTSPIDLQPRADPKEAAE